MNYEQTLDYMFNALPMFQRVGASAFKKDLSNTIALCKQLGNPENQFKSIHVAGTNGKGSTSHAICSVLMEAGYKVGLYTSPHLKSFTERIKINGEEIPQNEVVDFVVNQKDFLDELKPSFFEMTVGLAFWYFAKEKVDIAVIEVGMGGRFDSTNVIIPELSVITNIGYDHMQFLGDTLPKIAGEKAGIIKENIPVVISQRQEETSSIFEEIAKEKNAPIYYAEELFAVLKIENSLAGVFQINTNSEQFSIELDLKGNYQQKNLAGILQALKVLQSLGYQITQNHIEKGLFQVIKNTGLKGRWQQLGSNPMMICDTGHNEDGIKYILDQIHEYVYNQLFIVIGMVNDKDVSKVLSMLPKDAYYFFVQANIPRAMTANDLYSKGNEAGLKGEVVEDVNLAITEAKKKATKDDLIFIGGSTFVVAEINEL
ncbi:bifunctional folylpolyglutamate synthase/dihydrofolate synthase [Belliella aquatica]|uniref:Dihydrofolate synthase/folylpolyglutamate synthase n=1 Tax=Belliella aquatica TaxID=1323734 RepID=A0ABQ1MV20_9BACT|nr:folylpolyglutamate synthase/dihydrofolate synthase family protein [Belliella aquatica]MCH7406377.1 bifunctional folylpolyglutamate synthase/dihydrofolate synthase [Belliella aquatica]GGC45586.1 tetrahydrofolate synthase [Belliella aquatica]